MGLDNFRQMLADQRIGQIFANTLVYVAGTVLFDLMWAMALALAIHSAIPHFAKLTFRAVFFFPILTAGAVVAIVWQYLFNMDLGVINYYLGLIGIPKVPWLVSSQWVIPAVILMIVWNGVGFNMILLLAGLQSIPQELYEAASIDGAGRVAGFRFITLPLLVAHHLLHPGQGRYRRAPALRPALRADVRRPRRRQPHSADVHLRDRVQDACGSATPPLWV